MNFIIGGFAYILGLLMDVFFRGLTLIGYPRLWACIALYAIVTRLLFLPQRISTYRKTLLTPVVRKELLSIDPGFFEKTNDKDLTIQRAALKKEVYKKYKLPNNSGCLLTIIQFPFLLALFYVVKNPQEFIPSLEAISSTSAQVNEFLGLSLSAIPIEHISFNGVESLILCVPLIIVLSNILKMWPTLKRVNTTSQKIIIYTIFAVIAVLLGWFSATLPIVISLYWLVSDVTIMVFDFFIHKFLPQNNVIAKILKRYNDELAQEAASPIKETLLDETGSVLSTEPPQTCSSVQSDGN